MFALGDRRQQIQPLLVALGLVDAHFQSVDLRRLQQSKKLTDTVPTLLFDEHSKPTFLKLIFICLFFLIINYY